VRGLVWTPAMLLDTNFLIDLLDGGPGAVELAREIDEQGDALWIPTVVLFELWEGAVASERSADEKREIQDLVESYDLASFDAADSKAAGALLAAQSKRGRPLGTIDVLVAGMTLARSEVLVTGDKRLLRLAPRVSIRTYSQ
jgi:tRNA(fMet)-specific endonuclease VapC